MPISFTCPHCGAQTNVADQYAGQTGPCARCGQSITIPGAPGGAVFASGTAAASRSSTSGVVVVIAVVVGLFALVACGGVLVALLLPAVDSARGAARHAECSNKLKAIVLAMHEYHDEHGSFPPAYLADEEGTPIHSWRVLLLPYLDEDWLYEEYDFEEPWDGPNNMALADLISDVYRCPSEPGNPNETNYMVITGPGTMFEGDQGTSIADVTDGSSSTILVVEVAGYPMYWSEPFDLEIDTMDLYIGDLESGEGISSTHPGGANVAFADGSVRFIPDSISGGTIRALATKDGGEIITETW